MPAIRSLFDKKVRETAGAQTSARYQFQANVGLLKVLDLHEGSDDYSVVLDHFDDVVVIRRSRSGDLLDFYQVKTRSTGRWTIAALATPKKNAPAPASIIGKMYQNASVFGSTTGSICFLSDAGFDVKDTCGKPFPPDTLRISGAALSADEIQEIENSLEADFPAPRKPDCKGVLFLERSPMNVAAQATFVTGRLVQMLSAIGEDESLPVKAIYEALFASASAKAASSGAYVDDENFLAAKAVSRSEIEQMLTRAAAAPRFRAWWPALAPELSKAGMSTGAILAFQNDCLRYLRARAAAQFRPTMLGEKIAAKLPTSFTEENIPGDVLGYATALAVSAAAEAGADPSELRPIAVVEVLEKLYGRPG